MKLLMTRLTYANVVATLALFLALAGGTAFAASRLGKDSVGTKQLKANAVTAAKIKDGAVTGAKVQLSTLGTVPSATTAAHASAADSATHAASADHATTADRATNAGQADDSHTLGGKNAAQLAAEATPTCPAGTEAMGGLCFESVARPPTALYTAINVCAGDGRWLPSVGQILAFQFGHPTEEHPEEWSDTLYEVEQNKEFGYTVYDKAGGSGFGPVKSGEARAYRCVVLPS